MSKSDVLENDLLKLIFNATAIANMADNAAASPETNIGVALHTGAGPADAGTQLTNEAAYTSYAREDIARTSGGWTITTNSCSPVANIDFTTATGGSETETYFSTGKASSDVMHYYGTVTPNIVVTSGVTPRLTTASTITED
jgi:hypothetical protein